MERLPPSEFVMQPDPIEDDAMVTDPMPLDGLARVHTESHVPAPRSWNESYRKQQARHDAQAGLEKLARMVEPALRVDQRRVSQPTPVDIPVDVSVKDGNGTGVPSVRSDPKEAAVNDAFHPMDLSALIGERLNPAGNRLIQSIPAAIRPVITAQRHPHIINKMAMLWLSPKALGDYFNELLLSSRPTRRGFSVEVMDELFGLQGALHARRDSGLTCP